MSAIKMKKVKLVKNETLEISFEKTEDDNTPTIVTEKHSASVHQDLKNAFNLLSMHLACMTDLISVRQAKDKELVDPFTVTAYSIGGSEDEEGIILTGQRKCKNGKVVILNTPFTRFEEDEKTAYYFMDDLKKRIKTLEAEVLAYIHDGKKAADPQLAMEMK